MFQTLANPNIQKDIAAKTAKDTSDADLKAIFQLLATRVVGAGFNPDGKKDRGRLSVARGSGGKPNKKCC